MTASSQDTPLATRRHCERGCAACRSGDTLAVTKLDWSAWSLPDARYSLAAGPPASHIRPFTGRLLDPRE